MHSTKLYLTFLQSIFYKNPKLGLSIFEKAPTFTLLTEQKNTLLNLMPKSLKEPFIKQLETYSEEKIMADLRNIQVVSFQDLEYPKQLHQIYDPPLVLFYKGNISLASNRILSVVGPRKTSDYAKKACTFFTRYLCQEFTIASGLAEGIDTISHEVTLNEGQSTIAVIAAGLNMAIYPSSNQKLAEEISQKGLIMTEFPPDCPALPYHFPQRNRIISGLSKGILICEAHEKSGSLITAQFGIEQNKDIFVIPGSIFTESTRGSHQLIQEGAILVKDPEDILKEYQLTFNLKKKELLKKTEPEQGTLTKDESEILNYFSTIPLTCDELVLKTGKPVHEILQYLTLLELKGVIQNNESGYTKI